MYCCYYFYRPIYAAWTPVDPWPPGSPLPASPLQLPTSPRQLPASALQLPASQLQLPASPLQLPAARLTAASLTAARLHLSVAPPRETCRRLRSARAASLPGGRPDVVPKARPAKQNVVDRLALPVHVWSGMPCHGVRALTRGIRRSSNVCSCSNSVQDFQGGLLRAQALTGMHEWVTIVLNYGIIIIIIIITVL